MTDKNKDPLSPSDQRPTAKPDRHLTAEAAPSPSKTAIDVIHDRHTPADPRSTIGDDPPDDATGEPPSSAGEGERIAACEVIFRLIDIQFPRLPYPDHDILSRHFDLTQYFKPRYAAVKFSTGEAYQEALGQAMRTLVFLLETALSDSLRRFDSGDVPLELRNAARILSGEWVLDHLTGLAGRGD